MSKRADYLDTLRTSDLIVVAAGDDIWHFLFSTFRVAAQSSPPGGRKTRTYDVEDRYQQLGICGSKSTCNVCKCNAAGRLQRQLVFARRK